MRSGSQKDVTPEEFEEEKNQKIGFTTGIFGIDRLQTAFGNITIWRKKKRGTSKDLDLQKLFWNSLPKQDNDSFENIQIEKNRLHLVTTNILDFEDF